MLKPRDPNAAINNARYDKWLASFSGYVYQVTRQKIELWLDLFSDKRDIAARVLDSVLFIGHEQIMTKYRELLKGVGGWSVDPAKRKGRWFFVPFSGSSGESGDSMVHVFRMATGMTSTKFDSLFIHRSELVRHKPGPEDTVVLIDDFAGTGRQAKTAWNKVFAELITESPRVILLLVAATKMAFDTVKAETSMNLVCGTFLDHKNNLFDSDCKHFSSTDKQSIEAFCKKADNKNPRGSGDAGLLVILAHRCPNNSLPILHSDHDAWTGLFPR